VSAPSLAEVSTSGNETMKPKDLDGVMRPNTLQNLTVPERQWLVSDWIPVGQTTSLYGDGGTGKSLLAQQLMTAAAVGKDWLGLETTSCKTFGVFCEDDDDELHRRQAKINASLGVEFSDLSGLNWWSRVADENLLMTFDQSEGVTTAFFEKLLEKVTAEDFKAGLVIIDTAADTFGGNEIIRSQVRQFISGAMNKIAQTINGAVVLCAHPSRAGLASGEGDGASTAWNNSVRSRMYLERAKDDDDDDDINDIRILSRKKANYARTGGKIDLKWSDGAFEVIGNASGIIGQIEKRNAEKKADDTFLKCLDVATKQGRPLSHNKQGGNYAPKLMAKMPETDGVKKKDFEVAMERLFSDGEIEVGEVGKYANRTARMGLRRCEKLHNG